MCNWVIDSFSVHIIFAESRCRSPFFLCNKLLLIFQGRCCSRNVASAGVLNWRRGKGRSVHIRLFWRFSKSLRAKEDFIKVTVNLNNLRPTFTSRLPGKFNAFQSCTFSSILGHFGPEILVVIAISLFGWRHQLIWIRDLSSVCDVISGWDLIVSLERSLSKESLVSFFGLIKMKFE